MPHTDHQQNEANPTGGRDLGQITLQPMTIQQLLAFANIARQSTNAQKHSFESFYYDDQCDYTARSFVWQLFRHIQQQHGETTANAFAVALGFNHLIKE